MNIKSVHDVLSLHFSNEMVHDVLKPSIAEVEFSDIVEIVEESEDKLRIYLKDGRYIDTITSLIRSGNMLK